MDYASSFNVVRAPALSVSASQAQDVIAAVGADYKIAGFDEPGDLLLCAARGRSWLSPTGMHYRFAGISSNVMGPTFALVASVLGTIIVIRKLGVSGVALWGGVSMIAGRFGIDVDEEKIRKYDTQYNSNPAAASEVLEETLLELLPAGVRVGIRRALSDFEANQPGEAVAKRIGETVTSVVPGAQLAGWLFSALQKLLGVADADPTFVLRDEDKRALAIAIKVPYEIVDDTITAAEEALTS